MTTTIAAPARPEFMLDLAVDVLRQAAPRALSRIELGMGVICHAQANGIAFRARALDEGLRLGLQAGRIKLWDAGIYQLC